MSADLRRLLAEATPGPWVKLTYGTASTAKAAGTVARAVYATARKAGVPMTDLTEISAPERDGRLVAFTGNGPHSPENAALIVAAVNALPDLLALVDAARAVARWNDTTHGNDRGHDHHCPLGRGDDWYSPGDPARCTCGWALAAPALDALSDILDKLDAGAPA